MNPGEPHSSALPQQLLVLQAFLPADLHTYVWDTGLNTLQSVSSLAETSCWPSTKKWQRDTFKGLQSHQQGQS